VRFLARVCACNFSLTSSSDLIVGVTTRDTTQIVFYDTPGILDLQSQRDLKLPRQIATAPAHAISQVDHALLVIDASTLHLALRKLALARVLSMLQVTLCVSPH
jgi:GTPase Era involved in 16S rRNA processing